MLNKKELLLVNEVVKAFDNTCYVVANNKEIIIKNKSNAKGQKTMACLFFFICLAISQQSESNSNNVLVLVFLSLKLDVKLDPGKKN